MAALAGSIWQSIITAGPTRGLLLATNASFAALQLVLAALLYATYSIHFIVLSLLCGGLWWAINWFAHEIRKVQAEQEAKKARESVSKPRDDTLLDDQGTMDSGDDTETETEGPSKSTQASQGNVSAQPVSLTYLTHETAETAQTRTFNTGAAARLFPGTEDDGLRKRRSLVDSSGDISNVSTDSEWEKVEGDK